MTTVGQYLKLPSNIISARLTIILIFSTIIQVTCTPFASLDSVVRSERPWSGAGQAASDNIVLAECQNPQRDSCSFYTNCLESRYHCGPKGYPLHYGMEFCQKFSDDRTELSVRGQTWILDTMQCLQKALVSDATGSGVGVTCDSIEKEAFGTHPGCYIGSGLCTLPPSDWFSIVHIVGFKTLFENWDAFLATLYTGRGCLEFYRFLVAQAL